MKHIIFALLLIGGIYYYWDTRPVNHGPGVVAPETPVQEATSYKAENLTYMGYEIMPKATINLEARVLSIKNYYFDQYSDLIPTDVVFGWGPMSDERNLRTVMVRQSDRSFYWEMTKAPIPEGEMWRHASNMHLIGSNQDIRDKISDLRQGHVVRIEGYLVNASSPSEGWTIESSLDRKDLGRDASELVWINSLTIL